MKSEEAGFESGGERCAAWVYRPDDELAAGQQALPCVVMAHGFSLTRHDGLAPYAEALAGAGAVVVAFDHRFLGDSGGTPRQRFRSREQRADWRAAVAFARGMAGVDPGRIVLWGFSFSGGHAVATAAQDGRIAAVLALCPFVDGLARVLATPPRLSAWVLPRAVADLLGFPVLIPVTGPPGAHAAMTLPGEGEGFARAVGAGSPWRNEISPGVFVTVAAIRPVMRAAQVRCPLWAGLGERDISVARRAVQRLAVRAPRGELHSYPYDHFDPFTGDAPGRVAADQIAFLRRVAVL